MRFFICCSKDSTWTSFNKVPFLFAGNGTQRKGRFTTDNIDTRDFQFLKCSNAWLFERRKEEISKIKDESLNSNHQITLQPFRQVGEEKEPSYEAAFLTCCGSRRGEGGPNTGHIWSGNNS